MGLTCSTAMAAPTSPPAAPHAVRKALDLHRAVQPDPPPPPPSPRQDQVTISSAAQAMLAAEQTPIT